jgi:polyhydroxybutyrate depolymerase
LSRRRILAIAALVAVLLGSAAGVSASRGLPDLDLAGDVFGHGAPPRQAVVRPPAPVTTTVVPVGPIAGRAPAPAPLPPLPNGVTPTTSSITVGTMVRTYDTFSPPAGTGRVPALVVLHGRKTSLTLEESRDGLIQLAHQGKAVVVYPAGYGQSWNAGACCGAAQVAGIDDLTFLTDLIRAVGSQPNVSAVYLVGYSNGGRMAYDVVCAHPKLVSSFVVVAAVPVVACPPGAPVSLLEMVGTVDPILAYDAKAPRQHINGYPEATVTDQVALWRKRNGCSLASATQTTGTFHLQTWSHCAGGSVVALGTYQGAGHAWPGGGHGAPSGADVLWRFLTAPKATTPVPGATPVPAATPVLDTPAGPSGQVPT